MTDRGAIDVELLLKVVLVLVVIWIALEIIGEFLNIALGLLGPLRPILGLVILALIILWLLDRL